MRKCPSLHLGSSSPSHPTHTQPELTTTEGASITPLQALFMSQRTIKTPTREWANTAVPNLIVDIPDKFDRSEGGGSSGQNNLTSLVSALTRNSLKATSNTTPQPLLWQENLGCSSSNQSRTERCFLDTPTIGNLSQLPHLHIWPNYLSDFTLGSSNNTYCASTRL